MKCDKSNNDFTYNKDIIKFVNAITNIKNTHNNEEVTAGSNLKLTLKFPKKLYYSSMESMMIDCISHIQIKDNTFNIFETNDEQTSDILDQLPNSIFSKIEKFSLSLNTFFNN